MENAPKPSDLLTQFRINEEQLTTWIRRVPPIEVTPDYFQLAVSWHQRKAVTLGDFIASRTPTAAQELHMPLRPNPLIRRFNKLSLRELQLIELNNLTRMQADEEFITVPYLAESQKISDLKQAIASITPTGFVALGYALRSIAIDELSAELNKFRLT